MKQQEESVCKMWMRGLFLNAVQTKIQCIKQKGSNIMKLIDLFAIMSNETLVACKSTEGQEFIFKANRGIILSRGKEDK